MVRLFDDKHGVSTRFFLELISFVNFAGKERFLKFKIKAEGMEEIMFFHTEEGDDVRILRLLDVYKLGKL